ncbi:hypothetical protein BJ322DRAFT_204669 [Thelephora terrestris]|uniref:Thioredoxin-like fold domain-containing protein n=1 Tax=Thelephora terrestris TaxID=56493 RepID=A0A9P6H9C9_9AGAM|nr:hypothetical protein BJ322DRAFT_204669 [Thelephora terrestris]
MKPLTPLLLLVSLFSLLTFVYAQYYSAGWKPGQKVVGEDSDAREWAPGDRPEEKTPPTSDIGATPPAETPFHWSQIFTQGPIGDALLKVGFNYSAARDEAERRMANMWDTRIPLVTDDNYEDLITNEIFPSEEEEKERVWFLIVTIQADQPRGLSQMFDEKFDAAYDISVKENDLPHVKWGRIDYINVTALTTKWVVWQAPRLVVLTDRGRTLRFLGPNEVRLDVDAMRSWLKDKTYLDHPTWNTSFAPGGSNEWMLDYFAQVLSFVYGQTTRVPRIVLIVGTGAIGTFLVQFLHKGMAQKQDPRPKKPLPQNARKRLPASPAQPPVALAADNTAATSTKNTVITNPSTTNPPVPNPPTANASSPSKPKKRRGRN